MRSRSLGAFLIVTAMIAALSATIGFTRTAQAEDPQGVKDYLQQVSDQAAAARFRELANDPASPFIGDPKADVTIIEFFDYQCPYCKAAEPRLEQLIKDDHGVKLVLKDFPILTPESRVAARAALASQMQGKYQAFHEALIGNRGKLSVDKIFELAQGVGLDVAKLKHDMDAPEIADHIIANMNFARALKITVTPAFIVDTKVLSGVSADTATSKIVFPDEVAAARARKSAH